MNEKQRIIRLLTKHYEEYGRAKIYYNIAYNLIMNYEFSKSIREVDELAISLLVDNLWINNEMLDKDNIDEYTAELLNKRLGKHTTARINNDDNLFVLLNYYNIKGIVVECKKVYKHDYNILDL